MNESLVPRGLVMVRTGMFCAKRPTIIILLTWKVVHSGLIFIGYLANPYNHIHDVLTLIFAEAAY